LINESVEALGKEGLSSTARVAESFANSAVDVITHSLGKEAGSVAAGGLKFAQDLAAHTAKGSQAEAKAENVHEGPADENVAEELNEDEIPNAEQSAHANK